MTRQDRIPARAILTSFPGDARDIEFGSPAAKPGRRSARAHGASDTVDEIGQDATTGDAAGRVDTERRLDRAEG